MHTATAVGIGRDEDDGPPLAAHVDHMAMAAPASKPRTAALLLLCFLVASLLLASSFVAAAATEAYGTVFLSFTSYILIEKVLHISSALMI